MRTVEEWKEQLRRALREEQRARRGFAVTVLRETLAAIDNAEAADPSSAPAPEPGIIAGSVAGLGRGEVQRRVLSPEAVALVFERERAERQAAKEQYIALGRHDEAEVLRQQLELLEALTRE
jgi:uncharacterized protein YqeY